MITAAVYVCEGSVFASSQWQQLDRINVYVGGRLPSAAPAVTSSHPVTSSVTSRGGLCGSLTRLSGALYQSTPLHVHCSSPRPGGSQAPGYDSVDGGRGRTGRGLARSVSVAPLRGRFVYVELVRASSGDYKPRSRSRPHRVFAATLCDVMVYQ